MKTKKIIIILIILVVALFSVIAFLLLKNDRPAPQDKETIVLVPEKIKVKAYFNNNKLDPEITCYKVFPVEREVIKTPALARAAIEELLLGTTASEKEAGYFTSLNTNIKIQSLNIESGLAQIDFSEELGTAVGGSCRVGAIRAQIAETLRQFSSVQEVIISINGRTEDILQP